MRKLYLLTSILFGVLMLSLLLGVMKTDQTAVAFHDNPGKVVNGFDSAHIVVQFAPDDRIVRSITFTAPISGLAALEMTGLDVVSKDFSWGIAVCSIEGVGCPADDCFSCSSNSWNYSFWDGSDWQGYWVGADSSDITDSAVEGFRWGPWDGGSIAPAPPILAASDALEWLRPRQVITTGGYGNTGSSVDVLLAVGANGIKAADWRRADSPSLLSYWTGSGASYANKKAAQAGKLAMGLVAADGCWPLGAMQPAEFYSVTTGAFAPGSGDQAMAMLGHQALSQTVPITANQYLKTMLQADGGWEWVPGLGSDTNSTALAIQALLANGEGVTSSVIVSGLNYLKSAQNPDGGFTYDPLSQWGTDSDTNSTSYVVQAILAAGQDPISGTWVVTNTNPISYLLSMQLSDGSFEWQPGYGSNLLATSQAIPALLGYSFPIRVADLRQCPGVYLPLITAASP